ncbi:MAG TPA: DEAD/DEAH box helicase [Verrucomicrobiae bacterium]|nr:DEAD/DEAH box helicase [Verrucomicrobiae bacterium]
MTWRERFPFRLDSFQEQALDAIEKDCSVLVSAPTGSGKTVIAEGVLERARSQGVGVIYTAPIKALSNQKYRDFKELYGDGVGIVTGDVSLNPDAPIVIMTTEIYRNSLFENSRRIAATGWVIFDEIHYLNDPERGTVWEEAILFTPPHIRMLALSATVPNIDELAAWIQQVHAAPITVIKEDRRVVPLGFSFQCQGKIFRDKHALLREGYLNRHDWRGHGGGGRGRHRGHYHPRGPFLRAKPNRLEPLLAGLKSQNLMPCIYFVFGRKRAEFLASEAMEFDFLTPAEKDKILRLYDTLLERFQLTEEKSAQDMRPLLERGIGFHHAGMLPSLKEVVEQLFTSRILKLIFTTETFALGINMPARTVVFDELQKFYGNGFRNLTTRDFYQMAGRAGRRGMDDEGFVFMRIHPNDITYHEVMRVIYGTPEPILSQFNAAYATLLNLYRERGRELFEIYPRSLHHFQSSKKRRNEALYLLERKMSLLKDLGHWDDSGLTPKGEFAASLFGYELLLSEMHADGVLEGMSPIQLCLLLSAMVFEPRKDDHAPRHAPAIVKLEHTAAHYSKLIYRKEFKFRVFPYTRPPHFHVARAIEAWAQGSEFDPLFRLTTVDEGELIRNFRMVIQLLRELEHAPHASEGLKQATRKACGMINRDIVDAEKQLRA